MKRTSEPEAEKPKPSDVLVTFTVRLPPSLIKRTKLAATLLEIPVQTVVSKALHAWLAKHESKDQGTLLLRYAKKMKFASQKEGKS